MRFFSAAVPEVATPRTVARTVGAFYLAGGLIGQVAAWEYGRNWRAWATCGIGLSAVAAGAVVLRWGRYFPRWLLQGFVAVATGMITLAVAIAPSPTWAMALAGLYVFIAIDAFFFFAWPAAVGHLVFLLAGEFVALVGSGGLSTGMAATLGVVLMATSVVVGSLVRMASSANRDSLTGLMNRRGWDEALEARVDVADRREQPLAVALIDVDHFKQVNDQHGHAAGDDLLRTLAQEWLRVVPDDVVLARRGGDEFAVLMPGRTGEQGLLIVERMRETTPFQPVSCGVAEHVRGEGGGSLLRRTDTALYAAKDTGRQRSVLSGREHLGMVPELAAALQADQLDVAFQPIVALADQEVVAVEALARWEHPTRGQVSPAEFVPAAETAGLVGALGMAILRKAVGGVTDLQQRWGRELKLTVNVSGRELNEPGYPERVMVVLEETRWRPERLIVEVTETLVEAASAVALETLDSLRARGIAVAIDDFGTGYSAFSRLDTLPADYLKLDHAFIAPILTSHRRVTMLRALLDLSHGLGLQVIAEGVEISEQADLLTMLGCPFVQGYHYGPPAPTDRCALPVRRLSTATTPGAASGARPGTAPAPNGTSPGRPWRRG